MTATASSKSPTYKLVAEKVGADTVDWLAEQREAGASWRWISVTLWSKYRIGVTEVTLRRWWADAQAAQLPRRASA